MNRTIWIDQAVYGSFTAAPGGYHVLAQSAGVRPESLRAIRDACTRFGERPAHLAFTASLMALPLDRRCYAIIGVSDQGTDDCGRPGALAFHSLIVSHYDYRRLGCDPFALAPLLRRHWPAATTSLERLGVAAGNLRGGSRIEHSRSIHPAAGPPVDEVARTLAAGARVALVRTVPPATWFHAVWDRLPVEVRGRCSLATLAFSNRNRFDLVALPRANLDDVDPGSWTEDRFAATPRADWGAGGARRVRISGRRAPAGQAVPVRPVASVARLARSAILLVLVLGSAAGFGLGLAARRSARPAPAARSPAPDPAASPPGPNLVDRPIEAAEVARATAELQGLARRFGVAMSGDDAPTAERLIELIDGRLRYRGPLLDDADRSRLGADPAGSIPLAWDRQVRRFVPDRPLPRGWRSWGLHRQLLTLAWSFHLAGDAFRRRPAAEVVQAIGDRLAFRGVLTLSAEVMDRAPALYQYRQFLQRLPRY